MLRRFTLSALLGVLIFTVASCAQETKEETPAPAAADTKPAEPEGPFYELTKDEITSHADWTSKNITYKGVKIGEKSKIFEEKVGKFSATDGVGSHYRAIGEGTKFALYTQKMTGEVEKLEIYSTAADQVADPKLKKLLSSGDLEYMRKEFGMEDSADFNPDTTAMEWSYKAKGFSFAKYDLKGTKMNAIIFAKIKPVK